MTNASTHAIAYLRTSSATNVEGDSSARQRVAIENYAAFAKLTLDAEFFYDAGVSGAVPVMDRPAFAAMVARIAETGVRIVVVEDATRFARDVIVQEIGLRTMRQLSVRVVTSSGIDLTDDTSIDGETIRVILGQFAAAEKKRLVAKLRGARDRKAAQTGRPACGRTHDAERLAALKELRAADPDAPYRVLSERLAERGFLTLSPKTGAAYGGKPISTTEIGRMVAKLERV